MYVCIVYRIEVNLKNLKTNLVNHTRLRTKGQVCHTADMLSKSELNILLSAAMVPGPGQITW